MKLETAFPPYILYTLRAGLNIRYTRQRGKSGLRRYYIQIRKRGPTKVKNEVKMSPTKHKLKKTLL